MADFGVTPEGFVLKRLADIRQDLVDALNNVVDPNTGETLIVDLSDSDDPLVQMVDIFSDGLSVGWEQLQAAYNQFDPLKATNGGLSGVVQLNGIRRKAGTFSTAVVTLTGTPNLSITAGKQISDNDDTFVWQLPQVTLDGSGNSSITATCTTKGPNVALSGTLIKILTPISGWTAVTNSLDASLGTLEETDAELRLRQQNSTSATGASVVDALYGSLLSLVDVDFVRVYVNSTMSVDSRGIPAKSVAVVIVGGDDNEISADIFEKQAIGMSTFGTTNTSQIDEQGINYPINFTRPAEIDVFVRVHVTVVDASVWPIDGPDQIKEAILAYANGNLTSLGITTGYDRDGYVPGDSVYASELYVPVNSVVGTQITFLRIGTSAPASGVIGLTIDTDWNEIVAFSSINIYVNVTL